MTEHISLELAKEIAEKYRRLGVDAPNADETYCVQMDGLGAVLIGRYTAAEIFSALPSHIHVWKDEGLGRYHCVEIEIKHYPVSAFYDNSKYPMTHADTLVEALALMLCRVLEEQIKQKGV